MTRPSKPSKKPAKAKAKPRVKQTPKARPRRPRTLTRARKPAPPRAPAVGLVPATPPPGLDPKVQVCIDVMLAGRWVDGRTGQAIARAWGVSAHYMRKIAAEASRRVKAGAEPDYVREVLAAELSDALKATRGIRSPVARAKAVAEVARAWGAIVVPSKHEVTGGRGLPLGLPPALAMLEPAPSVAEVEHFASVDPEACELVGCRVHGRALALLPNGEGDQQG